MSSKTEQLSQLVNMLHNYKPQSGAGSCILGGQGRLRIVHKSMSKNSRVCAIHHTCYHCIFSTQNKDEVIETHKLVKTLELIDG